MSQETAGLWTEPTTPEPSVTLTEDELMSALRAVDHAYEAAHHLADIGRVDFEAFRPLVRALRILRDARDRLS